MIGRIKRKINSIRFSPNLSRDLRTNPSDMVRLGTKYGGWKYSPSKFIEGSWAMLCGAGEDISFDLAFQQASKSSIVIVDPTPRAITHWQELLTAAAAGETIADRVANHPYNLDGVDLSKIQFLPFAIWNQSEVLRFWEPENAAHVSHSATNLQQTSKFIEVDALTPADIAKRADLNLDHLGLIKLDIEGAESVVIDWLLENGVLVPQILLEFDELTRPSRASQLAVRRTADKLMSAGYELVAKDGPANYVYALRA